MCPGTGARMRSRHGHHMAHCEAGRWHFCSQAAANRQQLNEQLSKWQAPGLSGYSFSLSLSEMADGDSQLPSVSAGTRHSSDTDATAQSPVLEASLRDLIRKEVAATMAAALNHPSTSASDGESHALNNLVHGAAMAGGPGGARACVRG